jgi:hypothetical protein
VSDIFYTPKNCGKIVDLKKLPQEAWQKIFRYKIATKDEED